jgi:hypothetical protein
VPGGAGCCFRGTVGGIEVSIVRRCQKHTHKHSSIVIRVFNVSKTLGSIDGENTKTSPGKDPWDDPPSNGNIVGIGRLMMAIAAIFSRFHGQFAGISRDDRMWQTQ